MRRFLSVATAVCAIAGHAAAAPGNSLLSPAPVTGTLCTAYTTPGTYTYVVSPNARWFSFLAVGGGSSGAAGFVCTSGTACSGGAGGSGGGVMETTPTPIGTYAAASQTIVVGAGGAAVTGTGTAGNPGTTTSVFGNYFAYGAGAPSGGASGVGSASGSTGGMTATGSNASGATAGAAPGIGGLVGASGISSQGAPTSRDVPTAGAGSPATGLAGLFAGNAMFGPSGGGSGGGIPATPALEPGGAAGHSFALGVTPSGGATAGAPGASGTTQQNTIFGTGGGGGANNIAGNAGSGGAAANGGGGGGGGSSIGGTAGGGGKGGDGGVMVCTGG